MSRADAYLVSRAMSGVQFVRVGLQRAPPVEDAAPHSFGRGIGVKGGGIERPANPAQRVVMLLVVGIPDGLQEARVAAGAADILGWAGPFAFDADRITGPGRRPKAALEKDLVPPRIPEVVCTRCSQRNSRPEDQMPTIRAL